MPLLRNELPQPVSLIRDAVADRTAPQWSEKLRHAEGTFFSAGHSELSTLFTRPPIEQMMPHAVDSSPGRERVLLALVSRISAPAKPAALSGSPSAAPWNSRTERTPRGTIARASPLRP